MILNMTGGGNAAQFIEFTVPSSTDIYQDFWTVSDVKIPKGTVKGFLISRYGSFAMGNGSVLNVWKNSATAEEVSGLAGAVMYYTGGTNSIYPYNPSSGTDFEYDADAMTFKFRVRVQGAVNAYLSAGTYQLVIW